MVPALEVLLTCAGIAASGRAALNDLNTKRWIWAAIDGLSLVAALVSAAMFAAIYSFSPSGL